MFIWAIFSCSCRTLTRSSKLSCLRSFSRCCCFRFDSRRSDSAMDCWCLRNSRSCWVILERSAASADWLREVAGSCCSATAVVVLLLLLLLLLLLSLAGEIFDDNAVVV